MTPSGPLGGTVVVELGGVGPGPFCAMVLSDYGADVVKVDPPSARGAEESWLERPLHRGRRRIGLDLKSSAGRAVALALTDRADVAIEGFRPGVAERLGLGPEVLLARNPRLVFGRMTGWGREGPYTSRPGHDINYISVSGALHGVGGGRRPEVPLNLVGDFGGGGMVLAAGICAALVHAARTGEGQVVDAAMLDGSNLLMASVHGLRAGGRWSDDRAANPPPGPAFPGYAVYETADGRWVSVGCLEPAFLRALLDRLGLGDDLAPADDLVADATLWPGLRRALEGAVGTRTRDELVRLVGGVDTCFAPVLTLDEAMADEHNQARGLFVDVGGIRQAAPAPRFERTPAEVQGPCTAPGTHTVEILTDLGFDAAEVDALLASDAAWASELERSEM